MNLESLSIAEIELLLVQVTRDTPNKPIATASQVLRLLCKLIDDLRKEKAELKSKIENLRVTVNPEGWGVPIEKSPSKLKTEILNLFN